VANTSGTIFLGAGIDGGEGGMLLNLLDGNCGGLSSILRGVTVITSGISTLNAFINSGEGGMYCIFEKLYVLGQEGLSNVEN